MDPVENVARAFYEAQDDAHSWESERLFIKHIFFLYAREAIAFLNQDSHVPSARETALGAPQWSCPPKRCFH